MSFISVEDITVQVGTWRAFEHTSWSIEKGQHWAILGETGSGKTTLARALCRQLPLVHGQIRYFFDAADEGQGRPFPNPGEILALSTEAHQDFLRPYAEYHQARWQSFEGEGAPRVGDLLGPGSGAAERAEILRLLNLEALLERRILHLSNGESRKVLIARLWLQSPRLLVLDDPYTGLDVASRAQLAQAVEALASRAAPQLLLVTAHPSEIPDGIQRVTVVQAGQIIAMGEREAVLRDWNPGRDAGSGTFRPPEGFSEVAARYAHALLEDPTLSLSELVRMRRVSIQYGGVQVLRRINWTVRRGEHWALMGPNGAGKTTLLSLVQGDNPQAYANDITLFGRQRGTGESIWEIKRRIGWVSPELQVYYPRDATTMDVVCSGFFDSSGLYRHPSPDQSSLAGGWLRAFGLQPEVHQPFHRLSAGQQRLALLARALVKSPPLLILDEPCQGLDDAHRRYFVNLLDELCARAPLTLLYVTHRPEEIPLCVTHTLRLDQGVIVSIEEKSW